MSMKQVVLFSLVVFLAAGCATTGKKTGYLENYEQLSRGKYLEGFRADQAAIGQNNYTALYVKQPDITKLTDQKGVTAAEASQTLTSGLKNAAQKESVSDRFLFEGGTGAQAEVQIAITEMNPGSASGRFWGGEFGMGHAIVQVEGKVVDTATAKELATFSERRQGSGAVGMRDLGGDSGPAMVREMLQGISDDIVRELQATFKLR